jgi:hypothetical protein
MAADQSSTCYTHHRFLKDNKRLVSLSSGSTLLSKHAQAYIFSWGSPPWPATGCSAYELFANGLALGPVQVEAGKRCARVMEIRNDWLLVFPIYHCHKIIFFNSFYTWEGSSCASTIFLHKGIVPETLEIQVFFPAADRKILNLTRLLNQPVLPRVRLAVNCGHQESSYGDTTCGSNSSPWWFRDVFSINETENSQPSTSKSGQCYALGNFNFSYYAMWSFPNRQRCEMRTKRSKTADLQILGINELGVVCLT